MQPALAATDALSQPRPRRRTLVKHEGNTFVYKWGVTRTTVSVPLPPPPTLVKPASSLIGIIYVRSIPTLVDASYPLPGANSPPTTNVVQFFKVAALHPLERFAQGFGGLRPQQRALAPRHTLST